MTRGSELPLRALSAGFPVKVKDPIDLSGKGWAGPRGTMVYTYWTNFSRNNTRQFKIVDEDPKLPGYWGFKTNLDPNDLMGGGMKPNAVRTFLYRMVDIYRVPEE